MSSRRLLALVVGLLAMGLFALQASAQQGSVHGAAIYGLAGGGCLNLTGTCTDPLCPPDTPHIPYQPPIEGKIPCTEYLKTTVTFQSPTDGNSYYIGTQPGEPVVRKYLDGLGIEYTETAIDSQLNYGSGTMHYAEYGGDSWMRTQSRAVTVPGLAQTINGNPDYQSAYALTRVVDGSAIGFELDGQSQLLQVAKDQQRDFEVYIKDLSGFTNFSNPAKNPFIFAWVVPNKSSTPHLERQSGINLTSRYDQDLGRWRYFIEVVGPNLPRIGKYVVHFRIEETTKRLITYCSTVEHYMTANQARALYATLVVSYGIDECISQAGVKMPSLKLLLDVYEEMLARTTKLQKKYKKLASRGGLLLFGSAPRAAFKSLQRTLKLGEKYLDQTRDIDSQALAANLGALSALEQAELITNLRHQAGLAVTPKKSRFNMERIAKLLSRCVPRFVAYRPRPGAGKTKVPKVLKRLVADGFLEFDKYMVELDKVLARLEELKQNQIECAQLPI